MKNGQRETDNAKRLEEQPGQLLRHLLCLPAAPAFLPGRYRGRHRRDCGEDRGGRLGWLDVAGVGHVGFLKDRIVQIPFRVQTGLPARASSRRSRIRWNSARSSVLHFMASLRWLRRCANGWGSHPILYSASPELRDQEKPQNCKNRQDHEQDRPTAGGLSFHLSLLLLLRCRRKLPGNLLRGAHLGVPVALDGLAGGGKCEHRRK